MSDKCLFTRTLLYISVRHTFIRLTSFTRIPKAMRVLQKGCLQILTVKTGLDTNQI